MALRLESAAFKEGDTIPHRYTCMGEDLSPPLHWGVPPAATKSFVIIVDDPDAPVGTWVHWVIYDIPLDLRGLTEGIPAKDRLPNEAVQGLNDFKRIGYGGPCPPPGKPHRYYFKLYALDTILNLKPRATKAHVLAACKGHVLAEAQLMSRFAR
ncbi:MAG: YbhB/YbcL family Raf kinase inhibitor-like protein [Nitrospira sp.]|nr:YbhB/YbcL family Raf kinase inhibitor-like protein [Nitrospira sp.]MDH5337701.1 YbhB/YbcL family Raf kinase inhibitor-like protein [Nitrospira sp.]